MVDFRYIEPLYPYLAILKRNWRFYYFQRCNNINFRLWYFLAYTYLLSRKRSINATGG